VLLRPFLPDVMGGVTASGRVVKAPRLLGIMSPNAMQPVDRLVGHRLREVERLAVLALLNADELLVLGDHRVVLTGFGSQEAPVVVKAPGVGPVVERTGRALLLLGRQMPLADRRRRVAVLVEDLRKRRRVSRPHRRIARKAAEEFRNTPQANRVMVAPRRQRGPLGRAYTGAGKGMVPHRRP